MVWSLIKFLFGIGGYKSPKKGQIIPLIPEFSEQFISMYPDFRLDYSVESLEEVDNLLEKFAGETHLNKSTINGMADICGCYILEVAKRNFGGEYEWSDNYNDVALVTGEGYMVGILPREKVKLRLKNGEEDNIPFYFEGFIQSVETGKSQPGYAAIIM